MVTVLIVFAWCVASVAQTVSPVSSKFTGGGKGDLILKNDSLNPKVVTLEAVSFRLGDDRKVVRSRLDPHIHVKFSKTGVRIAPKDSVHIYFSVSADSYPAWCMIYATFMDANPNPGVKVAAQIGHSVYMYQKETIAKDDVNIQKVTFDPVAHKLQVVAENRGGKLARPTISFPQLHDNQIRLRLYPLFPHETTTTNIDLSTTDFLKNLALEQIVLNFDHFKISIPVTVEEGDSGKTSASAAPVNTAVPGTRSDPFPATSVSSPSQKP